MNWSTSGSRPCGHALPDIQYASLITCGFQFLCDNGICVPERVTHNGTCTSPWSARTDETPAKRRTRVKFLLSIDRALGSYQSLCFFVCIRFFCIRVYLRLRANFVARGGPNSDRVCTPTALTPYTHNFLHASSHPASLPQDLHENLDAVEFELGAA